jgi:hypothetical protein
VRRDGTIKRAALVKLGVPRAQLTQVAESLSREGLEITKTFIRVPVREQLLARLGGGAIALKAARASVVGSPSVTDLRAAVSALVNEGLATVVMRGKQETLVASSEALTRAQMETLDTLVTQLTVALKPTRRKSPYGSRTAGGYSLLASDVQALLTAVDTLRARAERPTTLAAHDDAPTHAVTQGQAHDQAPGLDDVLRAINALREPSGLTFVPTLVRTLESRMNVAATHAALSQGVRSGVLELRPESGMGRLSADELSLCVAGAAGSRLSWVRRLERRA